MLDSMRALSKSLVSKILMLLLVASFVLWGVGDMVNNSGPAYAAKVGSTTIGINEFQQQRSMMARQLQAMGMQDVDPDKLNLTLIRQLVQQKLTLLAMEDTGLFVNDQLLMKNIASLPEFQENGKFSSAKFNAVLQRERLPEKVFVSQIKKEIAGKFLISSLSMNDAHAPASVLTLEALANGETRDAVLLTIPARDARDEGNDEALKKYYDENKETLYMQPERRTLEYVVLTPAEVDALVDRSISDEAVEEARKVNPEMNKELLRMKLRGEQREEAIHTLSNTVEDELAAGSSIAQAFEKAGVKTPARSLSDVMIDDAKTSTDDVTKTVAEQGFGLSEGEISSLISTKKGTRLMVAVKSIKPASPKPYEEVKADVAKRLSKQLARDAARAKAVTVKEALSKSPNWQAAASEHNLNSRVVSNIARPIEGKLSNAVPLALQHAIFERNVGEVAGPLSMENGDQVLALITESHLPKIDSANVADAKASAEINAQLAQDIENRAMQAFAERHTVVINPAVMQEAAAAGGQ